ncbi:hypothetical protein BaRGS_00014335 [Batillaria attramentaria]|uniref:Uncharacterized protein n=1 Tax=Batillaria attramentaria TaxID=370345 RepID=A0ABD0L5A7_9CAEN
MGRKQEVGDDDGLLIRFDTSSVSLTAVSVSSNSPDDPASRFGMGFAHLDPYVSVGREKYAGLENSVQVTPD